MHECSTIKTNVFCYATLAYTVGKGLRYTPSGSTCAQTFLVRLLTH